MQIYTIKNGQNCGPYSQSEIMARITSGEYTWNDLGWFEGCTGRVPLFQIMAQPNTGPKPQSQGTHTTADLMFIAWKQKAVIWISVAWVVCGFMPMWEAIAGEVTFAFYAVHVLGVVVCWQLARALGKNVWLWAFLTLVPLVNLVAFARLVSLAGSTLKKNGVRTGITGTRRDAFNPPG